MRRDTIERHHDGSCRPSREVNGIRQSHKFGDSVSRQKLYLIERTARIPYCFNHSSKSTYQQEGGPLSHMEAWSTCYRQEIQCRHLQTWQLASARRSSLGREINIGNGHGLDGSFNLPQIIADACWSLFATFS